MPEAMAGIRPRARTRAACGFPGSHGPASGSQEKVAEGATGHAWARRGDPGWPVGCRRPGAAIWLRPAASLAATAHGSKLDS